MAGNPLFNVAAIVVLIAVLASVIGFFVVGARDTGDYAGSAMHVTFDPGDERVTALVMDRKNASYVNVTMTGWGGTVKARLDDTGSRLVLGEDGVAVEDGVLYPAASTAVDANGTLVRPPHDDATITVHVVGVAPRSRKVLRHQSGSI